MNVEARLYAGLSPPGRGGIPGEPVLVSLPSAAVVADLLAHFALRADDVRILLVNGRARPSSHPLSDGDRVALFPPVGGG